MKLLEELRVVAPKWWGLGIQLEVPVSTLSDIADKNDPNAEQSLNDMLREWMKQTKGVSWEAIVVALRARSVGEDLLATEIEMRHCPGRSGKESTHPYHYSDSFLLYRTVVQRKYIIPLLCYIHFYPSGGGEGDRSWLYSYLFADHKISNHLRV